MSFVQSYIMIGSSLLPKSISSFTFGLVGARIVPFFTVCFRTVYCVFSSVLFFASAI